MSDNRKYEFIITPDDIKKFMFRIELYMSFIAGSELPTDRQLVSYTQLASYSTSCMPRFHLKYGKTECRALCARLSCRNNHAVC